MELDLSATENALDEEIRAIGRGRRAICCGKCPPIKGGGYDCTCKDNPRCPRSTTAADLHPVVAEHQIIGTQTGKQGAGQVVPEDSVLCIKCGWMRCSDYTWHLSDALAADRAETTTSTRCPGCGHPACPHPRLECGGEWAETTTEGTQPGCTGAGDCPAPAHLHGCFADTEGHCNDPDDHPTEATTATIEDAARLVARMLLDAGAGHLISGVVIAQALADAGLLAETTTATDEDAGLRDRLQEAIAPVVAPYTSGPMDPLDVQVTDAVMDLLATARTLPTETEWGVRWRPYDYEAAPDEYTARLWAASDTGHPVALVRREVTAWTEADRGDHRE